ncbi:hypothetical protein BHE74_00036185 [Ensete ventricosum]|nr:hypothetical protein BHE74_00036185 [Ensete ventricosum]
MLPLMFPNNGIRAKGWLPACRVGWPWPGHLQRRSVVTRAPYKGRPPAGATAHKRVTDRRRDARKKVTCGQKHRLQRLPLAGAIASKGQRPWRC